MQRSGGFIDMTKDKKYYKGILWEDKKQIY
jgi:hypothetical protein